MTSTNTKKTSTHHDVFIKKLTREKLTSSLFLIEHGVAPYLIHPDTWIRTEDNVGLLEIKNL